MQILASSITDLRSLSTKYLNAQEGDRAKRGSVGTYHSAGLSGYQATSENPQNQTVVYGDQGYGFPFVVSNPLCALTRLS